MIYYGIAAIVPLLCWAFNEYLVQQKQLIGQEKERTKRILTVVALLPIFLLYVLRYKSVGGDSIQYVRFFETTIRTYSFKELFVADAMRYEYGYRLYVKIMSLLTDNYTIYFLVTGIIIFWSILRFSLKYTQNPFLFFYLYITLGAYTFMETGFRQALAMTICLWAVDFLKDRKLIPFLLVSVLAYFFHKSAIIFVIVYPLCAIKKYDLLLAVYGALALIFMVGFAAFQNVVNELLGYDYTVEETGNGFIFMLFTLVLFAFSLFMMYDKEGEEKAEIAIVNLAAMAVLFWLLRLVSRTAERISYYYIFGLYIYFSQAVNYDKDKIASLIKWLLVLACLVLFVYRGMGGEYMFFWQGA